jgi:hypothetical protein
MATSAASGIANAATRSAINGESFGKNLIAALPDIIGQAVGGAIGDGIADKISRQQLIDQIADLGNKSRHEAKQLLEEAETGGIDRAGGRSPSETQLQERRSRFDKYEAGVISAGNADNPAFIEFKNIYEKALMAGDIYYNKSIPGVTGDFVRLKGMSVSNATGGALTASMLIDAESGYYAGLYKNAKTGELVYVNRGTNNRLDWGTNKNQAFGIPDPQYERAIDNAQKLRQANIDVTYVGHSLGGGLATAQAVVSRRSAIVFNPAAVHANTVGGAETLARQNSLVTNITVDGEFLSFWQDKPGGIASAGGRRVTLDPANLARPRGFYMSIPVSKNFNPFDNHSTYTVLDSIFYRYESGKGF